jgi:hypothetical protein
MAAITSSGLEVVVKKGSVVVKDKSRASWDAEAQQSSTIITL